MRTARIEFPSGREVMAAYWGFLSSGGLVLGEPHDGLGDGEAIALEVRIVSLKKQYRLNGHVHRSADGRALVAFAPGQGQEDLFNAAWADSQDVPERRHRRWPVGIDVCYRIGDAEARGRIINLSRAGCCLVAEHALLVGTNLRLDGQGFSLGGLVRWSRPRLRQMGIEFGAMQEELVVRLVATG